MFRTARWRLLRWNVLVLTLILLVLESAIYIVFSRQIYNGVDTELRTRAQQAIAEVALSPAAEVQMAAADDQYSMVMVTPDGSVISSECARQRAENPMTLCQPGTGRPYSTDAMQQVRANGHPDIRTVEFDGHPQRVVTFLASYEGSGFIMQIGRTAAGEAASLRVLRILLLLGAIFGILLSAAGSLFLAHKAFVPIRQAFLRQRQFTADASHELRTPLALIRANAEMLARHADRLPVDDCELIGEIIDETDHLNRLIGDLLTLARADADSVKIENRPVDFRALVNDVHEDVQRIAESRGIESDISLNGPVTVPGDAVRLRQLILILLDNALKYTDPGGRVDVSLDRQDNHARLVVSDTGIGIPPGDKPHIFERFYRVDRAREHESGGTGLGLSIAKWIAEAHGGTIKVESDVGKGSKFLVDLPAG